MKSLHLFKKLKHTVLLTVTSLLCLVALGSVSASAKQTYDMSQYQGHITRNQGRHLKHEVNFVIIKAENGGGYQDPQYRNNVSVMHHNHIPYGVYDYSIYANPAQAREEAKELYRRAPHARFYVNDAEENDAGRRINPSTSAWAKEIHRLTKKPAVLYSYLGYFGNFTHRTRRHYNAIWVAAYSNVQPRPHFHYDLWQYTANHHSHALHKTVDASIIPRGGKSLSFWTGKGRRHAHRIQLVRPRRSNVGVVKPLN